MAKTKKQNPAKVRYQVLGRVFVNDTLIDPGKRKDVFVFAAPGLEGPALKLAPEKAAPAPEKTDDGADGEGADPGQGSPFPNAPPAAGNGETGQNASKDAKPGQSPDRSPGQAKTAG